MTVCFANKSAGSESLQIASDLQTEFCFAKLRLTVHHLVSDFIAEGPPVPIPNTEVKLCYGEDTCLETGRENSSLLTPIT